MDVTFDPHPEGGFYWTCPGCGTRKEDAWGNDGRGWAINEEYAPTYCNKCATSIKQLHKQGEA